MQEVTDDKRRPKDERKRLQIEHAPHLSPSAKQIKLGDKISNIRDISDSPPSDWSGERRREYLDWAERVVAGCRGVNPALEMRFDEVLRRARKVLSGVPLASNTGGRLKEAEGGTPCYREDEEGDQVHVE